MNEVNIVSDKPTFMWFMVGAGVIGRPFLSFLDGTPHKQYGVRTKWPLFWRYFQWIILRKKVFFYTPAQRSWRGGILDSPCPSVRPSVRPSVCRRHGFRSISQVCFGISISNFICMLMVAIGRSLLIFSDVTFKMAAWWPYWNFWFPDSNFTLALNINFKLQRHNTYVYG